NKTMFEYTFIRKKRKTVTVRLDQYGNITVSAPLHYTRAQAEQFLSDHADWIEKKCAELAARQPLPRLTFAEGEKVSFFGKEYILAFWEKRTVAIVENSVFLPKDAPMSALKRFYARELKKYVAPVMAVYAQKMGVKPTKLSVTSARRRWGSCSAKNAISFSFHLAMCDPFAVNYVIAHELSHILHKNHSKAFWNMVERYFPDYKQARKYLKEKAYFMEII
ncbi:MAG: M48 family metallopeptidase, partial [Clostridia bacterium]|nr:M48 family metallopeptidase [Clostridia bacterium]